MIRISMVRAYVSSATFLCLLLAPALLMAADTAPTENPGAGGVVIENAPAAAAVEPLQTVPVLLPVEAAAPIDSGAPAAVNAPQPDPAKKDADAIITEGQDLAIKGAMSGDRLMVRAGRRMIRDGALLKKSQQAIQ